MVSLRTDLGTLRESARRSRVELAGSITATDVQKALENLDTGKLASGTTTFAVGNLTVSTSFISLGSNVLSSLVVSSTAVVFGNAAVSSLTVSAAATVFGAASVSSLTVTNGATVLGAAAVSSLTVTNGATIFGNTAVSALTVTNSATVFGVATVSSLNVTGAATVLGALTATSLTVTGFVALASGGSISWAAGDVTITHVASNILRFAGATTAYTFDADIMSVVDDGASLGNGTANRWSGLYLASGRSINWNNSDVLITHSANTLAFTGASIGGYQFDASISAPNPTFSGTTTVAVLQGTGIAAVSSLAVTTTATFFGNVTISTLTVTTAFGVVGTATLAGATGISALTVTTTATVFGQTTVSALTVTNAATIFGNTTVSALTVTNSARVGSLVVTTTGSVLGVLAVSSLSVTGTATVFGNMSISTLTVTTSFGVVGPSTLAGGLVGVTNSSDATAGHVGEYVQSAIESGSTVALASGVATNLTSIQLTAGDWDVNGVAYLVPNAASGVTQGLLCISNTAGTLDLLAGNIFAITLPSGGITNGTGFSMALTRTRKSLNGTTTVHFVVQSSFTVSSNSTYGRITARRVR